ncbi:MAG: hypothetical protein R3C45_07565 [Phycisphaerales bacterium]
MRRNPATRLGAAGYRCDIAGLIAFSAGAVLDDLEAKLDIPSKPDATLIDRVRVPPGG